MQNNAAIANQRALEVGFTAYTESKIFNGWRCLSISVGLLTDSAMRCLEGFYYRAVCPMARARENRPTKNRQTGEWTYPAREVVLEEVELYTLREYIDRRRKLLGLTSGSAPSSIFVGKVRDDAVLRRWWWDQPIDTDLESE